MTAMMYPEASVDHYPPSVMTNVANIPSNGMNLTSLLMPAAQTSVAPLMTMSPPYHPPNEEITTIFVVGMPDDMKEREFQNMFMFCPGFEAATLKHPNLGDDADNIPQYKKQTIGFVKLRTRFDALQARDLLNGRKVDAERFCILKAEIAKKNLHTKRGLSNEFGVSSAGVFAPSSRYGHHQVGGQVTVPTPVPIPSPKEIAGLPDFYPSQEYAHPMPSSLHMDYFSPPPTAEHSRRGSPTSSVEFQSGMNSGIVDVNGAGSANGSSGSSGPEFVQDFRPTPLESLKHFHRGVDSPQFAYSESLFEPVVSATGDMTFSRENRGFSSALYNSDTLFPTRVGSGSASGSLLISTVMSSGLAAQNSTMNGAINSAALVSSPTFPSVVGGPVASFGAGPGFRSLADYNPPCNTIYVGNLPSNANEEEIRLLFSRCPGFKRTCFRQRPNGPMCFIEFEDIPSAQSALVELHGHPLSNSVKGGMRLSFSKNPLGVRLNSHAPPTHTGDMNM